MDRVPSLGNPYSSGGNTGQDYNNYLNNSRAVLDRYKDFFWEAVAFELRPAMERWGNRTFQAERIESTKGSRKIEFLQRSMWRRQISRGQITSACRQCKKFGSASCVPVIRKQVDYWGAAVCSYVCARWFSFIASLPSRCRASECGSLMQRKSILRKRHTSWISLCHRCLCGGLESFIPNVFIW